MKFAACMTFAILLALSMTGPISANAAAEQCRFVTDKVEREACYQRQEEARAVRQKAQAAREAEQSKPIETMSGDDEQMFRAIRGICRGC